MSYEHPLLIDSLLNYIYTFKYRLPPDPEEQLLLHLLMYEMGHKYGILHLKKDAANSFARTYLQHWSGVKLSDFIPFAYRVSPADDCILREVMVSLATHNIHYLFETDPNFSKVFAEIGEFGKDMALKSCGLLSSKGENILENNSVYKPSLYLQCANCVSISRCNAELAEKAASSQGYPNGLYPCAMCSSLAQGFVAMPNWDVYICSECHEPVHVLSGNRFTPLRCPLVPCSGIPAPLDEFKASRRPQPSMTELFQGETTREKSRVEPYVPRVNPTDVTSQYKVKKEKAGITTTHDSKTYNKHTPIPSVTETENSFETPESFTPEQVSLARKPSAANTPTPAPRANAFKPPRHTPSHLELEYSNHKPEARKGASHLGLWKSPSRWFAKETKETKEK
jgi:hypothetical protein